jgi:two-component system, chemotaxis family, sensor kinase Cph1
LPTKRQPRVFMIDSSHSLDLSACDREPIHIPGAIQPHGVVLVVDRDRMEIVQVAGDVAGLLGAPVEALLGSPLEKAGPALARVAKGSAGMSARPVSLGRLLPPDTAAEVEVTLHGSGNVLVVEVEPAGPARDLAQELSRLTRIGGDLEAARDMEGLLDGAAGHVRALTRFDRVMIYRFLPDGSGLVVAEACDPDTGTYLHHRFPASDIPAQARALYLRNPIRTIPDVEYVPAPLVPQENPLTGGPLDLSDCALRSVSPVHLQYLRNMGVGASMSLSIVVAGELWGLVACHHREPRGVSPATRGMCTLLARFISQQVRARDEDQHHRQAARLRTGIEAWLAQASEDGFRRSLSEGLEGLRALLPCDGLAVVCGDAFLTDGKTPSEDAVRRILPWLFEAEDGTCRATDHLAGVDPGGAEYAAVASGALGAVVSSADSVAVLWFRAEQVETIKWGGNPDKPAEIGEVGALTPRRSFETWKQIVRQRGRPWTEASREAQSPHPSRLGAAVRTGPETLPARLRAETADAHARVERAFDLPAMLSSLDTYRSTLVALHGFFAVVEPRLEATLSDPIFYPARRKLPLLRADLHALGLQAEDVARLPHCPWSPAICSRHEALGTLYVLEGATLGGAIISRMAVRRLGPGTPTSYFGAYGMRRGRMWSVLKGRLLEVQGSEDWRAIQAASACFRALEAWLRWQRLQGQSKTPSTRYVKAARAAAADG